VVLTEAKGALDLSTDDDFEWDEAKAADNFAKHGVSFEQAREAFDDAFAIDLMDDREHPGEDRVVLFGIVENRRWLSCTP
jgi:uncharacterized protein